MAARRLACAFIALGCLLVLTAVPSSADGDNYGPAAFVREGAGARAAGMGNAFTAMADDAFAGFWNPAGLSQTELYDYQIGSQYAFMPYDMGASFLTYVFQVPNAGTFSASWASFFNNNFEGRDDQGNRTGNFNSDENILYLSAGRKMYEWVPGLRLGGSVKVLQQSLEDASGVGLGVDLGGLWQPVLYWDHMIGFTVTNLFQNLYWNTPSRAADASPLTCTAGLALHFLRSEEEIYFTRLNLSLDLSWDVFNHVDMRAGGEYWAAEQFAVRAGFSGQEVTLGLSYRPDFYSIDYAFVFDLTPLDSHQHRLSLSVRLK